MKTYDENAVTGLVQFGQHGGEQDELGGGLGEVGVLLLRTLATRLNLGRDDVRVAERLAELHEDVVTVDERLSQHAASQEHRTASQVGLASLALRSSGRRSLLEDGLDSRSVALEDTTVCSGKS